MDKPDITNEEIQAKYIAWRNDPINDQFDDAVFCFEVDAPNTIDISRLKMLKTPPVLRAIKRNPVKEDAFHMLLQQTLRMIYSKCLSGELEFKSLEGGLTCLTGLLKQYQLDKGKPTEIVKYEELKGKTPQELHQILMRELRSGRN